MILFIFYAILCHQPNWDKILWILWHSGRPASMILGPQMEPSFCHCSAPLQPVHPVRANSLIRARAGVNDKSQCQWRFFLLNFYDFHIHLFDNMDLPTNLVWNRFLSCVIVSFAFQHAGRLDTLKRLRVNNVLRDRLSDIMRKGPYLPLVLITYRYEYGCTWKCKQWK